MKRLACRSVLMVALRSGIGSSKMQVTGVIHKQNVQLDFPGMFLDRLLVSTGLMTFKLDHAQSNIPNLPQAQTDLLAADTWLTTMANMQVHKQSHRSLISKDGSERSSYGSPVITGRRSTGSRSSTEDALAACFCTR